MKIDNYSLQVNDKVLLEDTQVDFSAGKMNHLLGKNGVGKSLFAKDLFLNGQKKYGLNERIVLIASYSALPNDLKVCELYRILNKQFPGQQIQQLTDLLKLQTIDEHLLIKDLSDGQKQKLKLLAFLSKDSDLIILDEITNALDKQTVVEIHKFLQTFQMEHPQKLIINITHNLSDLRELPGNYFLIEDLKIVSYHNADEIIQHYIEG